MRGAVAMGIGAALTEQPVLGAERHGSPATVSSPTCCHARATCPPSGWSTRSRPARSRMLGNKGAGEAGVGGAQAAVANAVEDALAP